MKEVLKGFAVVAGAALIVVGGVKAVKAITNKNKENGTEDNNEEKKTE